MPSVPRPRALAAVRLLLAAVVATLALGWSPAVAQDPVAVQPGSVTDEAGALDAPGRAALMATLERFRERTDQQLTVVFVRNFSGLGAQDWADRTAELSQLDGRGPLLVIAARGPGPRAALLADSTIYDDAAQEDALAAVEFASTPASAAIAVANELAGSVDVVERRGLALPLGVGAVVLVAVVAALVVSRRLRRRYERTHHVVDEHGRRVDPASILDDEELAEVADRALVAVDDATVASDQAVARAEAAGTRVTAARTATQRAADLLHEAFVLRDRVDREGTTMSEADRRTTSSRIVSLCDEALTTLDGVETVADRLRPVEADLRGAIERVEAELAAAPTEDPFVAELVAAGQEALATARRLADDDARKAAGFVRLAERAGDLVAAASTPPTDETTRVATVIATRRGAVGALARTRLRLADGDPARLAAALAQAESDIASWRPPKGKVPAHLAALLLGGALVPAPERSRVRETLGGESHGSGANAAFPGSESAERLVAAGFGGRVATAARPTIHRI